MCGRFVFVDIGAIFSKFRITITEDIIKEITPRYNIAPSQYIPVIYQNKEQEYKMEMMKWGLVPFWAKNQKTASRMINARAETITTKPSFKHILKTKRCLVPASGFYEWKKIDNKKVPYYIELKNNNSFSFAGLYDIWKDSVGNELKTFTIITTDANNTIKPIHDRMPAILHKEVEGQWLNVKIQNPESIIQLLKPFPADNMKTYVVSNEVNNPRNDNAQLTREVN
ncbi:SOS response-associated peptidase [Candidatus Scalindua japonica]|nr:SOS response-associated peptidase [Candidatus Scalindua japonica]